MREHVGLGLSGDEGSESSMASGMGGSLVRMKDLVGVLLAWRGVLGLWPAG